jgi:hypothetical protein
MKYDHYLDYAEVTEQCHAFARDYPGLATLSSIGKTYEGRNIWALTLTDPETGAPEGKAGFLMDGNIHAMELTSSMTVLHTIEVLLAGYGKVPALTRFLKDYAVYAIPRINADGAELCLKTPYVVRGSVEKFYGEEDGVVPEDINGDGEILQMRIPDPAGNWKVSHLDPRIMERRGPFDQEGTFYRIVPEGTVRGDDTVSLRTAQQQMALDPNREFPFEWSEKTSYGGKPVSGPEPLHDVEVRALHDFILAHPNICFVQNFHTFGGLHISPAAFCPHLELPPQDAGALTALGRGLSDVTGYKCEGIFPPGAKDIARGSYTTWLYFERGVMAWVTELWDFHKQADPKRPDNWSMFFQETKEQFEREETTALKWDEERNGGRGFMPWTLFDHPQLGNVEIGGWREKFTKQNPPTALMEGVVRKGCACALASLSAMPRLSVERVAATKKDGAYEVEAVVSNAGFLPTASTQKAVELEIGADLTATLEGGDCRTERAIALKNLSGYSKTRAVWTVNARAGETLRVVVKSARAGGASAEITLR